MESIKKALRENSLHHAYMISGKSEHIVPLIFSCLEESGFKISGNPDIWHVDFDNFGIEESLILKELSVRKSIGDKKFLILSISSISSEAQNALLKLFEDPTPGTHFFVVASSPSIFIPTLLSRFFVVEIAVPEGEEGETGLNPKKFLKANVPERLEMIESIITDKDKESAINFLNSLEGELSSDIASNMFQIEEILSAKRELKSRAPSVKMLLEHVACVM